MGVSDLTLDEMIRAGLVSPGIIDRLVDYEECNCGENWEFVETREQAETVVLHIVRSYVEGLTLAHAGSSAPDYIG